MIKLQENGAAHWALRVGALVLVLAVVWWIPANTDSATRRPHRRWRSR